MSNLSTFAEVGIVDARASSGTLIIPSSRDIPGRVITFKDLYGATGNSTIALLTSTGDIFEDGTTYRTLQNPYDFITLYAASTTMWSIIGGTQLNSMRANIMSNSSNITSSITANVANTAITYTSFLYPQVGLSFTTTSNLVPPVNATTTGAVIGQLTSNYWQIYMQSTITSNIGASFSATSTIFANASITPAYSTSRISTLSLGNPTNRWFQGFFVSTITSSINADLGAFLTVSTQNIVGFNLLGTTIMSTQQLFCSSLQIGPTDSILDIQGPLRTQDLSTFTLQASTITAGTMTLDRLFNGPIASATTTQNLYPFSAGALVGFGSNVSQNGYYAEGHFRSTFTQVIQPSFDAGVLSNVVRINGIVSSQIMNVSTFNANAVTSVTGSVSSFTTNALTIGTGGGFINIPFIQSVLVSTIQMNNTQLNTSNITLSTINRKLYPYTSTLGVPASTFSLSGALANNITSPLVLYSNVAFPHAGFFNFSQSAIFSRTNATANVPQASIFYTPGIYPSTLSNVDAYGSLPYLGYDSVSSFTTLSETLYVSTTQLTRNIIYSDPTGNAYTANLFMSPITLQYVPNNSLNPE
jgi:hypothetical protein